jgi:hypothetical protein
VPDAAAATTITEQRLTNIHLSTTTKKRFILFSFAKFCFLGQTMSNELRQRVPASASASENSEVSTSSSAAAKATPAGTTATPATTDKPVSAEDSQRAVRFLAMLSLAILVVPLATWYLTQLLFGVGAWKTEKRVC